MVAGSVFRLGVIFVALLLSKPLVVADTSLYIPGFNEQPISVTDIGVDSNGRTTWLLVPGKQTGTVEPIPYSLTATMIQGPSDAILHASFPQIEVSLSCALNSGTADCAGQIRQPGMTITTTLRESMKPYLVQGGGSGGGSPPGPTPAPTQGGSNSGTGSDNGSSSTTGVMGFGVLVGGVVTGVIATLFMV